MNMQNELSIFVQGIVFFQIADPVQELKKAFGTNFKEPVAVREATSSSAIILVPGFATVSNAGAISTMIIPPVSFEKAQQVMTDTGLHRWSHPTSGRLNPGQVTDGHRIVYHDVLAVASISHEMEQ